MDNHLKLQKYDILFTNLEYFFSKSVNPHFSYNVCIRPEAGFCCVQYQVCSDPGSFSLELNKAPADPTMPDPGKQDADCKLDYIEIAGINQDLEYIPETIV